MARKNAYNKYIDNYVKKRMSGIKRDINKVINEVNDELYKEVTKMYDKLIDDFYLYKTTSYIRHGESRPGTQRGTTMYRGQDFKIIKGKEPKLRIFFNPNILQSSERGYGGYTKKDGTKILPEDPSHVYDLVMYGIRFPMEHNFMTWTGEYKGKYFSYKGTPYQIMQMFDKDFKDIASNIFYQKWSKTDWYNQ